MSNVRTRGAKKTTLGDLRSVSWPKAAGVVETSYQQRRTSLGTSAKRTINFLHTSNAATTATRHVPETRLQGPRRGGDSGTPSANKESGTSLAELRMEGFSAAGWRNILGSVSRAKRGCSAPGSRRSSNQRRRNHHLFHPPVFSTGEYQSCPTVTSGSFRPLVSDAHVGRQKTLPRTSLGIRGSCSIATLYHTPLFRWELGRQDVDRSQGDIFQAEKLQTNQGPDSILTTGLHVRISLAHAGHISCGSAPCSGSFSTCICICLGVNLTLSDLVG